jgi:hypothetical protein
MRLFQLGLFLFCLFGPWVECSCDEDAPSSVNELETIAFDNDNAPSNVNALEITFGKGIGVDKSYSTLKSLWVLPNDDFYYFLDARWHHFCNGSNGANLGVGIFYELSCFMLGAYVYNDWLSSHGRLFNQFSFGADFRCRPWNLTLNAYFPNISKKSYSKDRCSFEGGYQATLKNIDFTCQMVSLEFSRDPYCFLNCFELSGGIGPYYLSNKKSGHTIGGQGRITVKMNDSLYMNILITSDSIFKTRVQTVIGLTFPLPFCCSPKCCLECVEDWFRMPYRQSIIAIERCESWNFNWRD